MSTKPSIPTEYPGGVRLAQVALATSMAITLLLALVDGTKWWVLLSILLYQAIVLHFMWKRSVGEPSRIGVAAVDDRLTKAEVKAQDLIAIQVAAVAAIGPLLWIALRVSRQL